MTDAYYSICAAWPARPQSAEAVGEQVLQMVEKLEAIGLIFKGWEFLAGGEQRSVIGLDYVRTNTTRWVMDNVAMEEGDPDPASGYRIFGRSNIQDSDPQPGRGISLTLSAGSKYSNSISLSVGSIMYPADPSAIEFSQFEQALQTVVSVWNCPWASVGAYPLADFKSGRSPYFAGSRWRPIYGMAWMAYLSADRASGLVTPYEIATERLLDGGLLLLATEGRLDPDNPNDIKTSALLGDIMAARGGSPAR